MATTTTTTTTASSTPTTTPASRPALGPFPPCPPVVGTMGVDVIVLLSENFVMADTPLEAVVTNGLLEVGAAGVDVELRTREPAPLSSWVTAVEELSPLLVEDTRPTQQEEGFIETHCTFIACAIGYAVIPPGVVSADSVMAEFGGPSDVVASSVGEPGICSLTEV